MNVILSRRVFNYGVRDILTEIFKCVYCKSLKSAASKKRYRQ